MNTIALVGNPNCGKTTIFNALTGTNQHVGNWPGVTVEKKEGHLKYKGKNYTIIDLPGTYSLGAYSEDEIIARNYILEENPDVIINVVDATNLERNLYLTTQLLEMGANIIIALNMMDEVEEKNIQIDIDKLSKSLGVPITPTVGHKKKGMDNLMDIAIKAMNSKSSTTEVTYGEDIDKKIEFLRDELSTELDDEKYPLQWVAIKLLENDEYMIHFLEQKGTEKIINEVKSSIDEMVASSGMEPEMAIVDKRYEFINNIVQNSVKKPSEKIETKSDKIDKVLTHKYFGLPIFALVMFIVFKLTFSIGEDVLGEAVANGVKWLGETVETWLESINAPKMLIAFISDGVFGGVGAVLGFIPLIAIMYIFFGILEDSGYMARAAYIMDGTMRALGLHGKTFISMLIGAGCSVPGVMSTRTLESKKDRMIAILITPFVSCGAKLEVYLVFISAFFAKKGGLVLFSLYAIGILIALLMGKIFSKTLFKDEPSYFIMELPPYRVPTVKNVLLYMWENVSGFLKRAGTVIFAVVTLLWVLAVLPYGVKPYSEASILGKIGTFIAPIFKPAGFGSWQAAVGLFAGLVAKEAVVATLGMVYAGASEGADLIGTIQNVFTPLTAYSFMLMTLLYTPCAATIATIKKETNSRKWAWFAALYTFLVAWIVSVLVYQIGGLLGFK